LVKPDKKSLAKLQRQLKKELNSELLMLGFTGAWPEWHRLTSDEQHFVYISAWKYGGGYHLEAGYTKRGPHIAAYPFVKEEFWETIEDQDVRFVHTLPDCRRHVNLSNNKGSIPYPIENSDAEISSWVKKVCSLVEDLDNWLHTKKETKRLSDPNK